MLIHNQLWEQGVVGSNPAIPTKTKESTGIQKPVLFFVWHENPRPRPPSGAAAKSAGVCCGGIRQLKGLAEQAPGFSPADEVRIIK